MCGLAFEARGTTCTTFKWSKTPPKLCTHPVETSLHILCVPSTDWKCCSYLTTDHKPATRENSLTIEYDGECLAAFTGFEERLIATDEVVFKWSPEPYIALNESYMYPSNSTETDLSKLCARHDRGLDYL